MSGTASPNDCSGCEGDQQRQILSVSFPRVIKLTHPRLVAQSTESPREFDIRIDQSVQRLNCSHDSANSRRRSPLQAAKDISNVRLLVLLFWVCFRTNTCFLHSSEHSVIYPFGS